jgi:hypothetical protein
MNAKNIIFTLLVLLLSSCEKILLYEEPVNNPVNNFEILWNDIDQKYGGFLVKNLN